MVLSYVHLELEKVVTIPPQDEALFSGMCHFYYAKSSFSNDDSERLENNFAKWSEVFVTNMS